MAKKIDLQNKIIYLLESGRNISQACSELYISRQTFYNRIESDGRFAQKVELAQTMLEIKAKKIISEAINNGDLALAKRYLDKRLKSETDNKQTSLQDILEEIMDDEKPLII